MFYNFEPVSLQCAYPEVVETIPATRLGYSTNNRYDGIPPMMSDGRTIVASYQPQSEIDNDIVRKSGIQSNWQYRQYLTANADSIRKENFRNACNDVGYVSRYPGEYVPSPPVRHNDETYGVSDIKQLYLSSQELNKRMGYSFK
jgi:hypothetical protein